MIEFRTGKIDFPSRKGFGPQTEDETVSFSNPIQNFTVILTGYEVKYDKEDEHVLRINVHVEGSLADPTTVEVKCTLALRDSSGDWDNPYSGYVAYVVIAEI